MKKKNSKGILSTYLNWPIATAIYLFVVLIVVYIIDPNIGALLIPFFLVYAVFAVYLKFIKFNNLNGAIVKLAENISNRQRIYFSKIDLPHAVLDMDGKIIWGNDKFLEIAKTTAVGRNIKETFAELNKNIISNVGSEKINLLVSIGDHDEMKYKVHLRKVDLNELGGEEVRRVIV